VLEPVWRQTPLYYITILATLCIKGLTQSVVHKEFTWLLLSVCAASQSLRVDDDYRLVDEEDDPFASKFMSFEVFACT